MTKAVAVRTAQVEVVIMALTREFKTTVMELCQDPNYRKALLLEALETYLEGDVPMGNAITRWQSLFKKLFEYF